MAITVIDRRIPTHLAVLVGVTAGAYAITLAGVTALQSSQDARLIADREPSQMAAAEAARDHERYAATIRSVSAASSGVRVRRSSPFASTCVRLARATVR